MSIGSTRGSTQDESAGGVGDSAPPGSVNAGEDVVFQEEGDVRDVAAGVVEEYRSRRDCVVARAGYLDLLGKTWGCVMQGEGWVEICVVGEHEDGCTVWVTRMDAAEVGSLVGQDG